MRVIDTLPSRFLPYPNVVIKITPLTLGDLSDLSTADLKTSLHIIAGHIHIEPNMSPLALTYPDFQFLATYITIISTGSTKGLLKATCPSCNATFDKTLELTDIEFDQISEEVQGLPIITEIQGKELHFSPPTVQKLLPLLEKELTVVDAYALLVSNMPLEQARQIIASATGEEISLLAYIDSLLYHGSKTSLECPKCHHKFIVSTPLILPLFRSQGDYKDKIRFGTSGYSIIRGIQAHHNA